MACRVIGVFSFSGEAPCLLSVEQLREGFSVEKLDPIGGVRLHVARRNGNQLFGIEIGGSVNVQEMTSELGQTVRTYYELAAHMQQTIWRLLGRAVIVNQLFMATDGMTWARAKSADCGSPFSCFLLRGHSNGRAFDSSGWCVRLEGLSDIHLWVDRGERCPFNEDLVRSAVEDPKIVYWPLRNGLFSPHEHGPDDEHGSGALGWK